MKVINPEADIVGNMYQVKPVRDCVIEALQLWKNVYDPNAPQGKFQLSIFCLSIVSYLIIELLFVSFENASLYIEM